MKYLLTAFILLNISQAFAASKKCTEAIDQFGAVSINTELQRQVAIIEVTGFIEDQIRSGEISADLRAEKMSERFKIIMKPHDKNLKSVRLKTLSLCK
jgi:hypothetical protein